MNLKEAFRYQRFLDNLMSSATLSIGNRNHCLAVTKIHKKSAKNPDETDVEEIVDNGKFYPNDEVIKFIAVLIEQKKMLSEAITAAKRSIGFDIDAEVEANKFRQQACSAIKSMLRFSESKSVESGKDYKFNAEGNQMPYYYDIDVMYSEAFDRKSAKAFMSETIMNADKISAEIDAAMINTTVDFTPLFDINETFEDIMESILV